MSDQTNDMQEKATAGFVLFLVTILVLEKFLFSLEVDSFSSGRPNIGNPSFYSRLLFRFAHSNSPYPRRGRKPDLFTRTSFAFDLLCIQ
jgi:hypothetical protein